MLSGGSRSGAQARALAAADYQCGAAMTPVNAVYIGFVIGLMLGLTIVLTATKMFWMEALKNWQAAAAGYVKARMALENARSGDACPTITLSVVVDDRVERQQVTRH